MVSWAISVAGSPRGQPWPPNPWGPAAALRSPQYSIAGRSQESESTYGGCHAMSGR
jgi:hypothetical protein